MFSDFLILLVILYPMSLKYEDKYYALCYQKHNFFRFPFLIHQERDYNLVFFSLS
jgi:hypothetical protein